MLKGKIGQMANEGLHSLILERESKWKVSHCSVYFIRYPHPYHDAGIHSLQLGVLIFGYLWQKIE